MHNNVIYLLDTQDVQLKDVGGKGLNLCKLAQAGFNVPGAFLIGTQAYRSFLENHLLTDRIKSRISDIQPDDPGSLQSAAADIRNEFSGKELSPNLGLQLLDAYRNLGAGPVAVRSSATAEDLPDLSFAGQQDTFLNIIGEPALSDAIIDCWSSLWTARAIGYRARNNIPQDQVAMAVIVQVMVPAQAAGVLFTANPLSGSRNESVIDATIGLGEALVSGLVEPDHYVVKNSSGEITTKNLGSKQIALHSESGGGVRTQEIDTASQQALPDAQIVALAAIGQQIKNEYNFPQDIEWAWDGEQLHILQSRPITSLFPVPEDIDSEHLHLMFSFAALQGIMEPLTPLGQDTIRLMFAGAGSVFGFDRTQETQGAIRIAGERLWADITTGLRHPIGARLIPRFISVADPSIPAVLQDLKDDPELGIGTGKVRFSTLRRLAHFVLTFWRHALGYILHPDDAADRIHLASQTELSRLKTLKNQIVGVKPSINGTLELYRQMYHAFPYVIPNIVPSAAGGIIPMFMLNRISKTLTGSVDLALEITRGLPNNVTTQMDLELWETAHRIIIDESSMQVFINSSSEELAKNYLDKRLPDVAQTAVELFLDKYGMRGLGEIDIGRPRWREEPAHVMEVINSYLQIEDPSLAPDAVFQKGAQAAEKAISELESLARRSFGGWFKAKFVQGAARRVRALAGLRESPKFHIIQMMGIIRQSLLESGQELASAGILHKADDLFYLNINELESLAREDDRDWQKLVSDRRAVYQKELSRVQIPRLLLSDGRAYYEGISTAQTGSGSIIGSPVSPGVVEGTVRIVLEPQSANLNPGEILVCQGTDPAWTPLFLAAGGLVMEVGGMMTHGAIVAREYGIPAVVGVHQATTVLKNGQRIQVDGSSGEILLLD